MCNMIVTEKYGSGTALQLSRKYGINYSTFMSRIRSGMTPDEAIHKTLSRRIIYEIDGFKLNVPDISKKYGIPINILLDRIDNGMSIKEAVYITTHIDFDNIEYNGKIYDLDTLSKEYKINKHLLKSRISNGMSIDKSLSLDKRKKSFHTVNGFTGSYMEISRKFNINYSTLMSRIRRNIPLEEAIK